jgi:hypothetical protein
VHLLVCYLNKLQSAMCSDKDYSHCHLVVILHYWRAVLRQKLQTLQCLLAKIFCPPKLKWPNCGYKRSLIRMLALSLMYNVRRYVLAFPSSRAKHYKTNWPLKKGEIGCPETSVSRCQHASCNVWGERRPKLECGEKPEISANCYYGLWNNRTGLGWKEKAWISY